MVDACMLLPEYELADRSQKENGPWYQTFFVKEKSDPSRMYEKICKGVKGKIEC